MSIDIVFKRRCMSIDHGGVANSVYTRCTQLLSYVKRQMSLHKFQVSSFKYQGCRTSFDARRYEIRLQRIYKPVAIILEDEIRLQRIYKPVAIMLEDEIRCGNEFINRHEAG